jgi:hypothetical protein
LFNHFFRDVIPKKEVIEFLNQFAHCNHQFKFFYDACHDILDPFSKPWVWIQGLEVAGHVSSMAYFSKLFGR